MNALLSYAGRNLFTDIVSGGRWDGWAKVPMQPTGYARTLGQVYCRRDGDDGLVGFETSPENGNMLGKLHGGFLMTAMDSSLFLISHMMLGTESVVTLQAGTDFLTPGEIGEPIVVRGRVVKESGRLIWLRGVIEQQGGAALTTQWSAIMRKIHVHPDPQ